MWRSIWPASLPARACVTTILAAMTAAMTATVTAADWPQFRGPGGCGHAGVTGLPLRWSETENVAWKTPLEGLAWSSPIVVGEAVYLTTAVPEAADMSLRLVRLDARTGAVAWNKELFRQVGPAQMHKKNSHASPTPIAADGRIHVHFGPHGTACTTLDGETVWKTRLEYSPTHGNGGSPALAGDVLVICCDGSDRQFVVGLDRRTGAEAWRTARDTQPKKGFSFSTPLVIEVDGRPQAICPGSDAVFAYEPATGREIWRANYPDGYSVTPRPVFGAGLVFVSSGYDKPVLHAIDPTGQGDVTATHMKWRMDRGAPLTPSVVVVGDELYCVADNGIATCVDARTGREHWRERLGGNYSASPLHADGRIYFQDENGTAVVVKAGTTFEEIGRNRFADEGRTYASYAVADRSLLIRTEAAVYRIGTGDAAAAR
jgi:outer membrane protein assembly factor BamB